MISVGVQGVGVTQRGTKNSFHLTLLEKATSKEEVAAELGFREWVQVYHVDKVEKEGLDLSFLKETPASLILLEHKMGREKMDLRKFEEVKLAVLYD